MTRPTIGTLVTYSYDSGDLDVGVITEDLGDHVYRVFWARCGWQDSIVNGNSVLSPSHNRVLVP